MKMSDMIIFIICLTVFVFSFSTSGYCGSLYRCVNSQGSVMLTDNIPTNPDYKCTFAASYRESTPQERAKEQRETQRKAQTDRQEYDNQMKQEYDAQVKKKVELEKKWLEDRRKALSSGSSKRFADSVKEEMDKREELLKKDPEQYFYNKEQREKAAAAAASQSKSHSGIKTVVDSETGRVVHGSPIGDGGVVDSLTGRVVHGTPLD